ncbi:CPBP family intramembrane glutamic endopeptidase [Paenibacillus sp. FSL K6-0276]|uniref:CPBP family intramembrane glutamic endopeptidase n=1 Tax=Paenibacillus sp. FSL K6-0276 TaxID=2921450 RepID=UPI0030ECB99C
MLSNKVTDMPSIFEIKPTPLRFIVSLIFIHILFTLMVNLILFENGTLSIIAKSTSGWINETLAANLFGLVLEVVIFLCMIAKLSLRDLGLKKNKLLAGLIGTFLFWLAINIVDLCMTLLTHSSLSFNDDIFRNSNVVFGELLGQIFGNALLEEVLFRGFLLVQIYLLLQRINSNTSRIVYAMFISQSIFAAIHIPNRIYTGLVGMDFVYDFIILVILGVIFSLLYVLTNNLFFVIGVHSLMNVQLMFWDSSFTYTATLICVFLLTCILFYIKRKEFRAQKQKPMDVGLH